MRENVGDRNVQPRDHRGSAQVVVCFEGSDPAARAAAVELAHRLAIPFRDAVESAADAAELVLARTDRRLELREPGGRHRPSIHVDFVGGATGFRRRSGASRNQLIAKAVGLRAGVVSVLDATAGLARDAFLLSCLGCCVVAVERNPILAALIEDGIHRARREGTAELRRIIERIALVSADARDVLRKATDADAPDAVYIDPMYPAKSKTALAKKEMRICRRLVGDDADAADLLTVARSVAKRRVVVKRARLASPLGPEPDVQYVGKQVRYDVYLTAVGARD